MIVIIGYIGVGKIIVLEKYFVDKDDVYYMVIKLSMIVKEFYLIFLNILGIEGWEFGFILYSLIN